MADGGAKPMPTLGETPSAPSLALRGGLSGPFVDFDLLPELLADLDRLGGDRPDVLNRWSALLGSVGFDDLAIDSPESVVAQSPSILAANGAWRLAERLGLLTLHGITAPGREVAALADAPRRREALAAALAPRVDAALRGLGGLPILPLLRGAARSLAASTNAWVRECPGLVPAEVAAIVHWACLDDRRARDLVRDVEVNRDAAMHRVGPPDPAEPAGANAERHFERVLEFYAEHPHLGAQVPFSFAEELALAKLLRYCGLLHEHPLGVGVFCLQAPVTGKPTKRVEVR